MLGRVTMGLVLALTLTVGCKKKPPEPAPPPPPPQAVTVKLQVTSMSPSTVKPGEAATVKLYGAAFQEGATVKVSGPASQSARDVKVEGTNTLSAMLPALTEGTYDVTVSNPSGESSTLRGGLSVRLANDCAVATVNFGYNQAGLSSSGRSTLDGNMSCYQSGTGSINIDGHADARGTTDYNLALGQRRANTVKNHMTSGGVSSSRIRTTSYGEEKPIDRESNESAWAKNRRAEIRANP